MNENAIRIINDLVTMMARDKGTMADFYPEDRKITYRAGQGEPEVDFGEPLNEQDYNSTVSRLELMAVINIARPVDEIGYGRIQLRVGGADYLFEVHSNITDAGKQLTLKRMLG